MWVVLLQVPEPQLFDWLTRYGAAGVLAVAVIAFLMGWIVPGYISKQKDQDIAVLRASVDALQKELTEQIRVNAQAATMADKMREVARTVIRESSSGG